MKSKSFFIVVSVANTLKDNHVNQASPNHLTCICLGNRIPFVENSCVFEWAENERFLLLSNGSMFQQACENI